jgi:hypothetical protein
MALPPQPGPMRRAAPLASAQLGGYVCERFHKVGRADPLPTEPTPEP